MKNRFSIVRAALAASLAVAPSAAFAHMGIEETGGVLHSLQHLLMGYDHIAALVAVGGGILLIAKIRKTPTTRPID